MASSQITIKSTGLQTDPNPLSVPPGGQEVASNVVIRRNNIIQPRRGFNHYGTEFGSNTATAKQIFEYRTRLMRFYDDILQWDTEVENLNGESIFASFSQTVNEVQAGLRIKSIVANGNFYFTTNDGIKKISVASASGFSSANIVDSGGIKALNIDTRLSVELGSSTGFLPVDSTVAYRVVWGKRDANRNLDLGVPSERSVIYNSLQTMTVRDMMRLLAALDNLNTTGSYFDDGDYVSTLKLPLSATAGEIRTNLIALAEKLDLQRGNLYSSGDIASAVISGGVCTITLTASTYALRQIKEEDKIFLSGFAVTGGNGEEINGVQTVTVVSGSGGATPVVKFNTTATGTVTLTNESIQTGWFRDIDEPSEPAIPPTHNNLVEINDYLGNIIIELQSNRNTEPVAQFGGAPLDLTNVSGGGVNVTLTITGGDARDYVAAADSLFLSGSFTPDYTPILGLHTIGSVGATTIVFPNATTGAYTGSSSDTVDRILRFTDDLQETFLNPIQLTTTANVIVDINIPNEVTTEDFYQIYRSDIKEAATTDNLSDLIPDDEMRQVYEAFPTAAELENRFVTVLDATPETFFLGGAFLYTNPDTGEGILQANDVPPLAKDINTFKNYTFYANTSTLQRKTINLLGVENIITDYDDNKNPSFTLSGENATSEYLFVKGIQQVTRFTTDTSGNIVDGAYFNINTANNLTLYYVWFNESGSAVDPAPAGRTGIEVNIVGLTTADEIAERTSDTLSVYVDDFITTVATNVVTITNVDEGNATNATLVTGFSGNYAVATTTTGTGEKITKETTSINAVAGNLYKISGTADYFTLNTPYDRQLYYFWFSVSGGSMTSPALSNRTGVQISITAGNTAPQVATAIANAINSTLVLDATANSNVITTSTVQYGPTVNATEVVVNAGFTITTTQQGALDILLSNNISPYLAVQETAKSLVNVVNHDTIQQINAFYLSGLDDVPGIILFEAEDLSLPAFYLLTNTANTGNSFSPPLVPEVLAFTNTAATPTVITAAGHGLLDGDQILITASNSLPVLDGQHAVTVINANTFTVLVNTISPGTTGVFSKLADMEVSDNEVRPNRIYYSKLQQPEAVPIVNYLDVGASDKQILRIFPLRDSLFVFKEDGLYRISGEVAPFTVALFDSSCILVCPDSVSVSNNIIFGYTTQGISGVTENGKQDVSDRIDNLLLKLNTSKYENFKTASWGVGYDSDNSYIFYTVVNPTDEVATIAFYYSTLTDTWTTWDKTNTCGIVNPVNDQLYLGSGNFNRLEEERKNFDRTDYADYEIVKDLEISRYFNGNQMIVQQAREIAPGDVVYQEQTISIFDYEKLLKKLDIDPSVAPAYTISNAVWSNNTVVFTTIGSVSGFLAVGDSVVISDVNPVGYNGTYVITEIPSSTSIKAVLTSDPGSYITDGSVKYSYYETLKLSVGANMRTALETLTAKLDIDPGVVQTNFASSIAFHSASGAPASATNPTVITSNSHGLLSTRYIIITGSTTAPDIDNRYNITRLSANSFSVPANVLTTGILSYETLTENFQDIKACYNIIIEKLNLDGGVAFANYLPVTTTTPVECIVDDVNIFNNTITLNKSGLAFITGPLTFFKSYRCYIQYLPITLDNYLFLKQFSEAQFFFTNKTFTNFTGGFASDLIPGYTNIEFTGFGNGIYGNESNGENYNGGDSHTAPFRTYIPQDKQRCRYLKISVDYKNARESFSLTGITLTGRVISTRAYR